MHDKGNVISGSNFRKRVFEILHALRTYESKNKVLSGWSVCIRVSHNHTIKSELKQEDEIGYSKFIACSDTI